MTTPSIEEKGREDEADPTRACRRCTYLCTYITEIDDDLAFNFNTAHVD